MLKTSFDAALNDREWQESLKRVQIGQVIASGRGREIPVITPTHFLRRMNSVKAW
jgi:transcriptional regulator